MKVIFKIDIENCIGNRKTKTHVSTKLITDMTKEMLKISRDFNIEYEFVYFGDYSFSIEITGSRESVKAIMQDIAEWFPEDETKIRKKLGVKDKIKFFAGHMPKKVKAWSVSLISKIGIKLSVTVDDGNASKKAKKQPSKKPSKKTSKEA